MNVYMEFGELKEAMVVSWNTMISGFIQNILDDERLMLCKKLLRNVVFVFFFLSGWARARVGWAM